MLTSSEAVTAVQTALPSYVDVCIGIAYLPAVSAITD